MIDREEWAERQVNFESRLRHVEQLTEEMYSHRDEGTRLAESVDRLGLNATALQETLLQIDRNQQQLTSLGMQLESVEARAATKIDLEANRQEQERNTLDFRKQTLRRIYTTALTLVIVMAIAGGLIAEYQQHQNDAALNVCLKRNEQTLVIIDVLRRSGTDIALDGARRFEELIVDCEKEFK